MNESVLVIAAHPDDEVLGCGGTLARHSAAGDEVHILIIAEGATSRHERRKITNQKKDIDSLRQAASEAAAILGAKAPMFAGLPDNRLDGHDLLDIVRRVEKAVAEIMPRIVYTHHGGDLNVDHRIVNQAVTTACRPLPGSSVMEIYAFETVSSTEWASREMPSFQPNHFVAISGFLNLKLDALRVYESEMRPFPHARSLENVAALATVRGASIGVEAAEAFSVIRTIQI